MSRWQLASCLASASISLDTAAMHSSNRRQSWISSPIEHAGKVALISEAAGPRYREQRCVAFPKHDLGGFDAGLDQAGMRGDTGRLAECPRKVADREAASFGDLAQRRRAGEIACDHLLRLE
jgi:hypothetical protein